MKTMTSIRILSESELRDAVKLDLDAVDCIETAFAVLASGNVVMPPILSMAIEQYNGEVDVKTAYVPGMDNFAIKMSPGFFDNPDIGLPSTSGLMILFSARTGLLQALLLDNGYLTNVRTAAAGAVAAKHLSRMDAESVCVVGAGAQAELQLAALCLVRPVKKASVWGRDREKAAAVAHRMSQELGISVTAVPDIQKAIARADIVVTTTPSTTPLIMADWLQPGQHITAMGSDQRQKNELDPHCLTRASLFVPDRRSQSELLGELHHALSVGLVSEDAAFPELGDIVSGKMPGRGSAQDITICDLTGTGVQDTAIANFAASRAAAMGAGTTYSGAG